MSYDWVDRDIYGLEYLTYRLAPRIFVLVETWLKAVWVRERGPDVRQLVGGIEG